VHYLVASPTVRVHHHSTSKVVALRRPTAFVGLTYTRATTLQAALVVPFTLTFRFSLATHLVGMLLLGVTAASYACDPPGAAQVATSDEIRAYS